MKRFWVVLLGCVAGGVIGGCLGVWGVLWIGGLIYGPRLEQGALVVLFTGPAGALLGLLVGALIGVRGDRRR